ncbi:unnamed protein product [Orchesella dallaii]|uniref:Chitin-binding type-2 domain-containing protein n=1 Tax=Orchesella dallaii TaxID=48710 RepID=A0ABP1R5K2_9HEXA
MMKTTRKRRMKAPLFSYLMAHLHLPKPHLHPHPPYFKASLVVLSLILCSFFLTFTSPSDAASVDPSPNSNFFARAIRNTNNNHHNFQFRTRMERRHTPGMSEQQFQQQNHQHNNLQQPRYFLEQQNEYDSSSSGVSILDDDTLRLSLAIDDDHHDGGGGGGSLLNAPSLHFLEPKVYLRVSGESGMIRPDNTNNYEVVKQKITSRARARTEDLHHHQQEEEDDNDNHHEIEEDEETGDETDDEMSDNYHHHFPYIESYREKYVKPDLNYLTPAPTSEPKKEGKGKSDKFIAQVTTPSSAFNEINSSASEHRLADFHFRSHLPSYFYNKYSSYSEEDLENVADLDDEHSKYFVKTRPRSVTSSGSNIYSNFYYEPPSFSTKSVPIPVKIPNRKHFVFASAKPPTTHHQDHPLHPQHLYEEEEEVGEVEGHEISHSNNHNDHDHEHQDHHDHHDDTELPQQDATIMSTILPNFTTPPTPKIPSQKGNEAGSNYKVEFHANKSSALSSKETLDVSTSQSILSKISLNNPDFIHEAKTGLATPEEREEKIGGVSKRISNIASASASTTTATLSSISTPDSTTTEATTTTTDATSIPGVPGVDYPILDEIPQTGFDCKNQRYKGFFADIDAKCQAWHYCDFTDGHSTFLCPNGTLFSQVLLTCDWWFNVDCDQATQLYVLNERLYRYIKPPKPSFPEDFTGEHVDKWLLQQLQMGLLPKVRKKGKAKYVTLPPPTSTTERTTNSESQRSSSKN